MDQRAAAHGVTISQWRYLRELWEEDGLSTGELTRRVGRQGPTTVVAVQLLEKAGLVTVAKSDEDRRKSFIHLTRRGQRLAAAMSPLIGDVNDQAMADLTESEILTFKRLIVRHPANARCAKRPPQQLVRAADAATGRGGRTVRSWTRKEAQAAEIRVEQHAAIHHHSPCARSKARRAGAERTSRTRRQDRDVQANLRQHGVGTHRSRCSRPTPKKSSRSRWKCSASRSTKRMRVHFAASRGEMEQMVKQHSK